MLSAPLPWPQLRDELSIHPGPTGRLGEPTWSLYDPLRNLYFHIDWLTFEVLCRWHLQDSAAIARVLSQETVLLVDAEAVEEIVEFLRSRELVKRTQPQDSQWMSAEVERRRASWWSWLLHHYLFFRVPLWRPDRWLERTGHWVTGLGTRRFAWVTMVALLIGLIELSRQWDTFRATLFDLFSWQGVGAYLVTLTLVKFLHELGHAYTARHFGCRVPTMGVAFLVMFPMAYTDVNDVWRLPHRRQRLLVGSAGILTELAVAAWATLLWTLLPDGLMRQATFLLATTTWVSTLLINASPFLRFDGYFLLMDTLGIANLHPRAFALARWRLRERLFALGAPCPERLSSRLQRGLQLFAWFTWLYRLLVFTGIAWLVFQMFPKPLGPFLALVELVWFIGRPLWSELMVWWQLRERILANRRWRFTVLLLGLSLLVVLLPWDSRIPTQGLLKPERTTPLVVVSHARLQTLLVDQHTRVEEGQLLVTLEASDLLFQRQAIVAKLEGLQWRLGAAEMDAQHREQHRVIQAERSTAEAELEGIDALLAQHRLQASHAGVVEWQIPLPAVGDWLARNQQIGSLIDPQQWLVYAYLEEYELDRITEGATARFFSESGQIEAISLTVERIDRDATRVLDEPMLASVFGGVLQVRQQQNQLIPELALYRVTLRPVDADRQRLAAQLPPVLRGRLVLQGEPKAWASAYWRALWAFLRREFSF